MAERCSAQPLRSQYPQGFSDISDLLEASEVYDVFNGNGQEVEYLFDHLLREGMNMRAIYFEASYYVVCRVTREADLGTRFLDHRYPSSVARRVRQPYRVRPRPE